MGKSKAVKGAAVSFDSRIDPANYARFVYQCRVAASGLQEITGAISLVFKPVMDVDDELVSWVLCRIRLAREKLRHNNTSIITNRG